MPNHESRPNSNRRVFLRDGSLLLLAAGGSVAGGSILGCGKQSEGTRDSSTNKPLENDSDNHESENRTVRIGMVTDLHYADKDTTGTRHYRDSIKKFDEACEVFKSSPPDFVVCLGDLIDAATEVSIEKTWLQQIHASFAKLPCNKHFVLGNHCVATLTKKEFLSGVDQPSSYYSFDNGGYHFVILDACYRKDGADYGRNNFNWTDPNIPQAQMDWLEKDLKNTTNKTIVFIHQRLDKNDKYSVNNADDVRNILERSGKVIAVFQGHNHVNDHRLINEIHYCTLMAMIEGTGENNNAYSILEIGKDDGIRIQGYRRQQDYLWN